MFSVMVMQAHTIYPSIELAVANDFSGCFSSRLKNRHHGAIISCYTTAIALHFSRNNMICKFILKPCMKDSLSLWQLGQFERRKDQKLWPYANDHDYDLVALHSAIGSYSSTFKPIDLWHSVLFHPYTFENVVKRDLVVFSIMLWPSNITDPWRKKPRLPKRSVMWKVMMWNVAHRCRNNGRVKL